jgi:hypothetical protein
MKIEIFFIIDAPQYLDLMKKYKTNLKLGVLLGIVSNIAVYTTRIANLEVLDNNEK